MSRNDNNTLNTVSNVMQEVNKRPQQRQLCQTMTQNAIFALGISELKATETRNMIALFYSSTITVP